MGFDFSGEPEPKEAHGRRDGHAKFAAPMSGHTEPGAGVWREPEGYQWVPYVGRTEPAKPTESEIVALFGLGG